MRSHLRNPVLVLCTLAFFATMVARLVVSPVVPAITEEFQVSNAAIGLALTGMWLAYALVQYPSGLLGDRIGERSVILGAVGGTAVASLALARAPNYAAFLVAAVVLGGVAGFHFSVATTFLTKRIDRIGAAIGIHNSGGPLAGLLAPPAAAYVGSAYGWRTAIALGAIVAVPVGIAFARGIDPTPAERPETPIRERVQLARVRSLLSRPEIAFTVALSVLGAFAWQSTASFLPTFVVEHRGRSTTTGGLVFAAYFVVHGVTQPAIGSLSDRIGRDLAAAGCMIVGSAGYLTLVTVHGPVGLVAGILLVGTGMGWGAALMPRFMDNLSDDERGAGFGLVRTVYMVLGSSGSVAVGLIADLSGWGVSFVVVAALLLVVFVALLTNRLLGLGY